MSKIICYFDFNSPYSYLSAVRLYQIHNNSREAPQYLKDQQYSTTDVYHPALRKVEIIPKPIEFGIVLKNMGQATPPIRPGSGRALYMWTDVQRSLDKMGINAKLTVPDGTWWPQKVSLPNRIFYLLYSKEVFSECVKELSASSSIESSKLSNQAWRDSIFDVSGSKLSDAISTEFLYRVFEKLFVEHKQVSDENELKSILDTL
ncbi:hypothetical protein AYI70_g5586, partial [Smittium culicis]